MALISSNKGIVKNDINFFAAFTANARKQAQALAAVAVVALVIVGITLAVLAVQGAKYFKLSADVKALQTELSKPEYQELEVQANNLQAEMTRRTQYLYTLSSMRATVDQIEPANVDLCDYLNDVIPNDTYIKNYALSGDSFTISGYTFNYYSALNMVNSMQSSNTFSGVDIEIANTLPEAENSDDIDGIPYVDGCYVFTISGRLTENIYITCTKYYIENDQMIALSGVQTVSVKPGETFTFAGVANYGENYTLTNVRIGGVDVTPDELQSFINDDAISGISQSSIAIECVYSSTAASEEGSEG